MSKPSEIAAEPHEIYDAIIVGAGGAGLAAAVSALQAGLKVLVLEKQANLGGTTSIAVGSFTANRTSLQRDAGVLDRLQDHVEDAALFCPEAYRARNNQELLGFFLENAADTLEWLKEMGLAFFGPSPEPPNRVPRMHNVVPNAKAYIAAFQMRLLQLGGSLRCNTAVESLMRESGRVVGVVARSGNQCLVFRARRGVVLAAGDYASSSELISHFKGKEFECIDGINPHSHGDGHRLAEQAGGQLVNMDITYGPEFRFVAPTHKAFHQLLPAQGPFAWLAGRLLPVVPKFIVQALIKRLLVTWQHPEASLFEQGAILINGRAERFCDERTSPQREIAVAQQPGKCAYILLDERLSQLYSAWPHFVSTAPDIAYAYVNDYLRLRPDVACEAATIESLARLRNLPPSQLRTCVEQYNASLAEQQPLVIADAPSRRPLAGSRWVLLGPLKSYFTTTEGGARINQKMQVLDVDGLPIPGLFAVGQNGLGGMVLWGHGLHIAWALTSGRLAGAILAEG